MCTALIINGKYTADGRPLLLKHRDQRTNGNRIEFQQGSLYKSINLVNTNYTKKKKSWCGTNEKGFAIISTASHNLGKRNIRGISSPSIINKALSCCQTTSDFEKLLSELIKPAIPTNYGVIDSNGNAAFYEVYKYSWKKYDVNDEKVAPNGYLVYTNFSQSGDFNSQPPGYSRYQTASSIIDILINTKPITPEIVFNEISRSYYNKRLNQNLKDNKLGVSLQDQDFIPNTISVASVIFQGVKPGEASANTIMWTVLGYPPLGIAVPLFVSQVIPHFMTSTSPANLQSQMWECSNVLYNKVFLSSSFSKKRFLFYLIFSSDGHGYMQRISTLEAEMIKNFHKRMIDWRDIGIKADTLDQFYSDLWLNYFSLYKELATVETSNVVSEYIVDTSDLDTLMDANPRYKFSLSRFVEFFALIIARYMNKLFV